MVKFAILDVEKRRQEKQLARDNDEYMLRNGLITPEELSRRNSFLGDLDMSKSRIGRGKLRQE